MKTQTSWVASSNMPEYAPLSADLEADVVVIGAGLTGLISAYLLAAAGKEVVVIEKNSVTEGATHLTTAFLTQIIDTDLSDLIRIHGEEKARKIISSHGEAIEFMERIVETEHIDCDWRRVSNFIYVNTEKQFSGLFNEHSAATKLGLDAKLSDEPLSGFKNFGAIEIRNQAKFHPLHFVNGLLGKLQERNVKIFEQTEAIRVSETPLTVETRSGHMLKTKWVIGATYEPFGQPIGLYFKKGMYTSYIIEVAIPANLIEEATYEDTDNPYHYFRIDRSPAGSAVTGGADLDRMIIGGEDHRSDIRVSEGKNFDALEEYISSVLGTVPYTFVNRWDGPILEPADGLPLIGPYSNPNLLYAAGFSGNGMTYAAIAGMIFRDIITGKENDMYLLYKASRSLDPKSLWRKTLDYGEELIKGAGKNILRRKK